MPEKINKFIIWILALSCALNLIFAINAGQKRRLAVSRLDSADAKLTELELRYKGAIQSYEATERNLQQVSKELKDKNMFAESLKDALKEEQKKSQALRQEFERLKKSVSGARAPVKAPIDNVPLPVSAVKNDQAQDKVLKPQPQADKIDRTSRKW